MPNRPIAAIGWIIQIDPTTRIAQRRIAVILESSPYGLVQDMRQGTDFSDEGGLPAADLPDIPAPHQDALFGIGPVYPPDFNGGVVPPPIQNIGFRYAFRNQRPGGFLGIDRQIGG